MIIAAEIIIIKDIDTEMRREAPIENFLNFLRESFLIFLTFCEYYIKMVVYYVECIIIMKSKCYQNSEGICR